MRTPAATVSPSLLDALVARLEQLAQRTEGRVLIGIAGMPAAGKTTLAENLVMRLAGRADWVDTRAAHLPMDGFHLANAELDRLELRDRKGAPQTFDVGGYTALLHRAAAGEAVWAPSFDRSTEQPVAQALPITANTQFVISEGNYLLLPEPAWQAARAAFAEVWYTRVDEATRLRRLIWRHVEFGKTPVAAREWVLRSDEPNARLVAPTADLADLIIDLDR
jgi:pantothenate kinase